QVGNQNCRQRGANGLTGHRCQHAEVNHNHNGDEDAQKKEEFALRGEIGFASLVDEFGNVAHRFVHGEILEPGVNRQTETQPEQAEQNAEEQKRMAVSPTKELDLGKVGKFQVGLAAGLLGER